MKKIICLLVGLLFILACALSAGLAKHHFFMDTGLFYLVEESPEIAEEDVSLINQSWCLNVVTLSHVVLSTFRRQGPVMPVLVRPPNSLA